MKIIFSIFPFYSFYIHCVCIFFLFNFKKVKRELTTQYVGTSLCSHKGEHYTIKVQVFRLSWWISCWKVSVLWLIYSYISFVFILFIIYLRIFFSNPVDCLMSSFHVLTFFLYSFFILNWTSHVLPRCRRWLSLILIHWQPPPSSSSTSLMLMTYTLTFFSFLFFVCDIV